MEVSLTDNIDIDLLKNKINNLLSHIGIEILEANFIATNIKKIQTLPKNVLYKINTNDNNKAFNLLSNKEDLKESEERLGDYILNKKDDEIFITILQNDNKPIRIRDIKSYLLNNTINIKNIRKLKLV